MKNKKHVITSHNVEQEGQKSTQSDVVIHNELSNGKTCQGLRHWRQLSNLKNNFSKPVRNDMNNKNKLDCFAFARNDASRHPEGDNPKDLQTLESRFFAHASRGCKAEPYPFNARVAQNDVINKNVKNLFPYFPISLSLKQLRRFRIKSGMTFIKQPAFTLAEVLITLGIIGIVAAMTIPTLMQKYYERQTVVKLKETYSILSQALKSAAQEEGLPEEWSLDKSNQETSEKGGAILKKYLKIATDCGTKDEEGACVSTDTYYSLNHTEAWNFSKTPAEYKMALLNGTSFWFRFLDSSEGSRSNLGLIMSFKVDTNGPAKPNVAGKDLFFMRYYEGKGLLLEGAPNGERPYTTSCSNISQSGLGCAYYVVTFGNMDYLRKK